MKENFLHYLWRLRRFDYEMLVTTQGETLDILEIGEHNQNAGPDFENARIRIGDTLWAGNVEMHINASEWIKHGHQHDDAYNNVILHVVYEEDSPIFKTNGERIACLELKKRIPQGIYQRYLSLLHNEYWIPCQTQLNEVSELAMNLWLDRLLVERLQAKTDNIAMMLEKTTNNWEETFYRAIARNFGLKINADPFEQLATSIPHVLLAKYKSNLFQIEALLFGQSGLLKLDFKDDYPQQLMKEYHYLQQKHQLSPLYGSQWKFGKLRPPSFPTIRLAQLAQLIYHSTHLFSKMLEVENLKDIEQLFDLKLEGYWLTHYTFDNETELRPKTLGKDTIHLMVINTIVPFLFHYGNVKGEDIFKERALQLLESLPPEDNNIIAKWKELSVKADNAYRTQALLQLKNNYCDKKKCLECSVGNVILKN